MNHDRIVISLKKSNIDILCEELARFFEPYQEPQFFSCEGSPLDPRCAVGEVLE